MCEYATNSESVETSQRINFDRGYHRWLRALHGNADKDLPQGIVQGRFPYFEIPLLFPTRDKSNHRLFWQGNTAYFKDFSCVSDCNDTLFIWVSVLIQVNSYAKLIRTMGNDIVYIWDQGRGHQQISGNKIIS